MRDRVDNMMKSLDYVIALVIISAGALAFIVLYNLTNINITERVREIATIKVLGFYPKETSAYVFRENFFPDRNQRAGRTDSRKSPPRLCDVSDSGGYAVL